jgi:hypothetical protein
LTLELDGFEWSASLPGKEPLGGWMGPRVGLDAVVKRKISSPYRDSNHPSIIQSCITELKIFQMTLK